jgi:hypothetical protein
MADSSDRTRPASAFAPRRCGWSFAVVICAVWFVAGARPARAGINVWTSNGPEPASVRALAIDPTTPTTIYAGEDAWEPEGRGGVFKSIDGGDTWSPAGLIAMISALAIDPATRATLYAGTEEYCERGCGSPVSVFKSTDGGATWGATGLIASELGVLALAILPAPPETLYAADRGVNKSTDSGSSWVNLGPASSTVLALAINVSTPGALYVGAAGKGLNTPGVFKTTDGGDTWSAAGLSGFQVNVLAIDPNTPDTLYAGTGGGVFATGDGSGVFKTTNGGNTWSAFNTGLTNLDINALAIDPRTPTTLYAGTAGGGVFKSTDGGFTWSALNTGLTNLNVNALAINPIEPRRVYAGTDGGVFAIEQVQVVGSGTPASCTEAALDAALAPGGLVTFDCGAAPVTITITSTKTIAQDTTIDGGGRITISGGNAVGVFVVNEGVTLELRRVIISRGYVWGGGGAIVNNGTLTVTNSTFSGNSASEPKEDLAIGGAIFNRETGTLTVTNSTFSGNSTAFAGGAIANVGTLTVTNSTFSGNISGDGGAIFNLSNRSNGESGTLTVTNSTFSGNSATNTGAAIANGGGGLAGGTLTVTNSTFSGNSASGSSAGAIDNAATCGDSRNAPCPAILRNTIVANSSGGNCVGTITDGGHNLDDGTTCGFTSQEPTLCGSPSGSSFCSTSPQLDPAGLKDNGGPTQTIALSPGSPAINAGDPDVCANPPVSGVDQRGYVRPGTGSANCSIGAFEYNSPGPPVSCVGDCGNDGHVTVDELVKGVNIALGSLAMNECPAFDANSDHKVTVDELVAAVNAALNGCGG